MVVLGGVVDSRDSPIEGAEVLLLGTTTAGKTDAREIYFPWDTIVPSMPSVTRYERVALAHRLVANVVLRRAALARQKITCRRSSGSQTPRVSAPLMH